VETQETNIIQRIFFAFRVSDPSDDEQAYFFVFNIPCLSDADAFSCSFLAPIAASVSGSLETEESRGIQRRKPNRGYREDQRERRPVLSPPPGRLKSSRSREEEGTEGGVCFRFVRILQRVRVDPFSKPTRPGIIKWSKSG
jgi:hypothetical protein